MHFRQRQCIATETRVITRARHRSQAAGAPREEGANLERDSLAPLEYPSRVLESCWRCPSRVAAALDRGQSILLFDPACGLCQVGDGYQDMVRVQRTIAVDHWSAGMLAAEAGAPF